VILVDLKNDSLAFGLHGAATAVAEVQSGTALPRALAKVFQTTSAPRETRGAIQDIAYRSLRLYGLTGSLMPLLTDKPLHPPLLDALVSCSLALLAEDEPSYEAFTVVNQAVDAAAADPTISHAKGVVNAMLRRFLREKDAVMPQARKTPQGTWNYPTWWIDRLKSAYPQDWQNILTVGNTQPPLTLRVNQRRTTPADYLTLLNDHGIAASQIGPVAIRLNKPIPVTQIPGFEDGLVSVQDAAAQLAVPLLDIQDGMRVLDACAAPGGKTGHLLETHDVQLTALDHDAERLARIAENLDRLGLHAHLVTGDARYGKASQAAAGLHWWDGQQFDRILADVPCTASGIVRRHPDIRWLRRKTDTAQLAELAARILDNLWSMLAPGGKMLFVTCSVWPQESEMQAKAFAERHQAIRLAAPGQLFPSNANDADHDGLFYALFEKPLASNT
jgi:16S rRNA (cytosine967-C5)-methyltransferase